MSWSFFEFESVNSEILDSRVFSDSLRDFCSSKRLWVASSRLALAEFSALSVIEAKRFSMISWLVEIDERSSSRCVMRSLEMSTGALLLFLVRTRTASPATASRLIMPKSVVVSIRLHAQMCANTHSNTKPRR